MSQVLRCSLLTHCAVDWTCSCKCVVAICALPPCCMMHGREQTLRWLLNLIWCAENCVPAWQRCASAAQQVRCEQRGERPLGPAAEHVPGRRQEPRRAQARAARAGPESGGAGGGRLSAGHGQGRHLPLCHRQARQVRRAPAAAQIADACSASVQRISPSPHSSSLQVII